MEAYAEYAPYANILPGKHKDYAAQLHRVAPFNQYPQEVEGMQSNTSIIDSQNLNKESNNPKIISF
ncbi:hypothetical protein JCM39068_43130 [Desulfocastanea catecholica]